MPVKKNPEEVEALRKAGALLARCLDMLVLETKPGKTGLQIDALAEDFIRGHKAVPAFKGYTTHASVKPFPGSICFSRNEVVVHGVPTDKEVVQEGDLITIDCGLSLDGWFADAARLFGAGALITTDQEMVDASVEALEAGINACVVGNTLGDVSYAIQKSIVNSPFFNVYQFCGHAIGRAMHEEPQVPNFGKKGSGIPLEPGMVFCLEPMLLRYRDTKIGIRPDGWTIVTKDQSRSTHIEHMVLVTEGLPEVLSKEI